ncbi:hypothetical protein D3C72_2230940 [compost metagenome]
MLATLRNRNGTCRNDFTVNPVELFHQITGGDYRRQVAIAFPFFVVGLITAMDHFIAVILEPADQKLQLNFD